MSTLVEHARKEMTRIGEEPEIIEEYVKIIQAFADMGHSGGSAIATIATLNELLQFRHLSPITDDPEEWMNIAKEVSGGHEDIWQSKRNPEIFSNDGGHTYYILSESDRIGGRPVHTSKLHDE